MGILQSRSIWPFQDVIDRFIDCLSCGLIQVVALRRRLCALQVFLDFNDLLEQLQLCLQALHVRVAYSNRVCAEEGQAHNTLDVFLLQGHQPLN